MKSLIPIIKEITNSKYLDVIGVILVVSVSIILKYYNTTYEFNFNGKHYTFFLGYVSIVNTCFSMLGTRLVTKKNNFGNLIATCNTMISGTVDYLMGNIGAILTYPVSFIGNFIAYRVWKKKKYLNSIDSIFFRNLALGFILSFGLNYLAFNFFSEEAINWKLFFAVAIPAGISFGATFNLSRMYPDNWLNWQIYNLFKIIQNIMLMNVANTVKYMFYMFNAIIGYLTWKSDEKEQKL